MTPFEFSKYLKNNPLLKENVNMAPESNAAPNSGPVIELRFQFSDREDQKLFRDTWGYTISLDDPDLPKMLKDLHTVYGINGLTLKGWQGKYNENVNEAVDGGNDSAAMIAWLKNKYGPFVPITPEEKKDLDYAGIGSGPESPGVFKLKTPIANPDEDDDSAFHTKVAYVHLLKADEDYEAPYYYEVRETVEYPGDFEEGFGGYGYPDGIWNGTEFEPVG